MASLLQVQLVNGSRYAVSSGHALASAEAIRVMECGGNVVDAAITGAAVLSVVLPYAAGIGGDLSLLYHDASARITYGVNGTGSAPAGATPSRFPGGLPEEGILSATVPGVVAAWDETLRTFGSHSLSEALGPAIRYAADGFPMHAGLHENAVAKESLLAKNEEAARLFLPYARPCGRPQRVVQTDLARSLRRIAENGAREFYEGSVARDMASGIAALGGLITLDDLARHRTLRQEPMRAQFYGHGVVTMPPNSLGLRLLLQLLALEAADIANTDPASGEFWESTIASWRWARHECDAVLGDPARAAEPARQLLKRISTDASAVAAGRSKGRALPDCGDTSGLVIVDTQGNAVSLMQSVSGPFASGIVVQGTGILLNNRMRGFDARAGSLNCVAPGLRPAHTVVPVLVAREEGALMAIGTPGAAGQTITLAQVLARALACRQSLADAIAAPRWSIDPSGAIIVERSAPAAVIDRLRHSEPDLAIREVRNVRFGSVKAAWIEDSSVFACADYRRVAGAQAQ